MLVHTDKTGVVYAYLCFHRLAARRFCQSCDFSHQLIVTIIVRFLISINFVFWFAQNDRTSPDEIRNFKKKSDFELCDRQSLGERAGVNLQRAYDEAAKWPTESSRRR